MSHWFRPVQPEDFKQVCEWLTQISPYQPPNDQHWLEFDQQPNCHAWMLCDHEGVHAYGCVYVRVNIRGGRVCCVEDIVVKPGEHGQLWGTRMMQWVESWARDHDCYKLSLMCRPDLQAWYRMQGYEPHGVAMHRLINNGL